MSARYAAWIRIGGRVGHANVEPLLAAIRQASVSLEWGDAPIEPRTADELPTVCRDGHLWLCDDQASYGEFPELEAACRKLGLEYTRHTEAALDCDGELVDWRRGITKPVVRIGSNVHTKATFVPVEALKKVIAQLEAGRSQHALRALRKLCPTVPDLPPFEII